MNILRFLVILALNTNENPYPPSPKVKRILDEYNCDKMRLYPDPDAQSKVMSIIYDEIKAGEKGDKHKFIDAAASLRNKGCEAVVLACTELSVFNVNYELNSDYYIDALSVVTKACIEKCGGEYLF